MPSADRVAAYTVVAALFMAMPGPSVLFTVGRAITVGRRAALLTTLGNATGFYVHVVAVALGIGAVVQSSVAAFTAIKLLGALYLGFLGVQAIRHRHALARTSTAPTGIVRTRRVLLDGFVVGVTNPKTIVFFIAVLPQVVDREAGAVQVQMLLLGLIAVLIGVVSDSTWALAAGAARTWLTAHPRRLARLNAAGGTAMIGIGLSLVAVDPH